MLFVSSDNAGIPLLFVFYKLFSCAFYVLFGIFKLGIELQGLPITCQGQNQAAKLLLNGFQTMEEVSDDEEVMDS